MEIPMRQDLEEYARSLDLSLDEIIALLDGALAVDPAPEPGA